MFCNRVNSQVNIRFSIAPGGAADAVNQYLYFDFPLVPNDTFALALDIGLAPKDVVRAYASAAQVTVSLFGE